MNGLERFRKTNGLKKLNMDRKRFVSPFGQRPWMAESGAAAAAQGKCLKGVIAGGITGGIEMRIIFPTELDEKGDRKCYTGIADCVKKTVKERGIPSQGRIPKTAARFGTFEYFRAHMVNEKDKLSNAGKLLCGLGAGVCEAVVGFVHGVRTIVQREGISGVHKGVTAIIFEQGSNQAIRFFVMENLKDHYMGDNRSAGVPKLIVGVFGAIAGAASVFGNTPLEVVKTRMQGLEASKYKNTVDCAVQIWKNEGPRAFFKGTAPRLGRVCLDVAITFMIYESFMDLLNKVWQDL